MSRAEEIRVTRYGRWLLNSCQSPGRRSEAPARSPVRYADCLARPNYLVLHLATPPGSRTAAQAMISNASKNQPIHNSANRQYPCKPESPRLAGLGDLMRFFVIYFGKRKSRACPRGYYGDASGRCRGTPDNAEEEVIRPAHLVDAWRYRALDRGGDILATNKKRPSGRFLQCIFVSDYLACDTM